VQSFRNLEEKAKDYYSKKMEFKLLKTAFLGMKRYIQKEIFLKTGQAEKLADNHRLSVIGKKVFSEWKVQTKMAAEREKLSMKHSVFSAWKHYAKQNSLVKKYLKECDFSSGNYDSRSKSPARAELKGSIASLSDENLTLSPVEQKENKGLMNSNHPNVLANTQPAKYSYSKYY